MKRLLNINYFKNMSIKDKVAFKVHNKNIKVVFIIATILLSLLLSWQFFYFKKNTLITEQKNLINEAKEEVLSQMIYITNQARAIELDYVRSLIKGDSKNEISASWIKRMNENVNLDQIRILDTNGNELIRVNYNHGFPSMVEEKDLQDKSDRYYYLEAKTLSEGFYLISEIDLNKENDQIEINPTTKKVKPTVRITVPVYKDNIKKGYLVINFLAQDFLDSLANLSGEDGNNLYFMNNEGYFLNHENNDYNFGFSFGMDDERYKNSIDNVFPFLSEHFKKKNFTLSNKEGLFTLVDLGLNKFTENTSAFVLSEKAADGGYLLGFYDVNTKDGKYLNWNPFKGFYETISYQFILLLLMWVTYHIFTIITFKKKQEINRYKYIAEIDELSGSLTRRAGYEILKNYSRNINVIDNFALAYIDLNGLKQVNDFLGHDQGDLLIKTLSKILLSSARDNDNICRIGGDEFLVFSSGVDKKSLKGYLMKVEKKLNEINMSDKNKFIISISYGITDSIEFEKVYIRKYSTYNSDNFIEEIIKYADKLMYKMKKSIKTSDFTVLK